MLALSTAFKREAAKSSSKPVLLVEFVSITNGKFVQAGRRVLGYPSSVVAVNARASSLDPLRCTQTVSALEVEFLDDGYVRSLVKNNKLLGKQLKVSIGFDTGDDATFVEGDYAGFTSGIIENIEIVDGSIRIEATDPRSAIFSKNGATIKVPRPGVVDGQHLSHSEQGAATEAMKDLLIAAGLSSTWSYNAASYAPASSPNSGHVCVDRLASLGRDLREPTPVDELLGQIAIVLRGYNLIQEDGKISWKEVDPAGAVAGRFYETDIIPGSVKIRQDFSRIVNAVAIRSAHEEFDSNGVLGSSDGFRVELRDDDATAQADWEFSDGTDRVAEFQLDDFWFSSVAPTKDHAAIPTGTGTIDIVDKNFAGSTIATPAPNVVDASHPGYVLVRGFRSSTDAAFLGPAPIEIIKYTSITSPAAGILRLGGITRGQLGTAEVAHAAAPGNQGLVTGPVVVDVTAIVRCADQVLKRFKEGATVVEFKTPLHTYAFQLADLAYLELANFLRYNLDGLAAGNTTVFEVSKKDTDHEAREITWVLTEIRAPSRTGVIKGGGNWTSVFPGSDLADTLTKKGGGWLANQPAGTGVGSFAHGFVEAVSPATSANLTTILPKCLALTRSGQVAIEAESKAFTASKDTYVDLVPYPAGKSHWRYTEVANGAAAPAIATGELRAFKVVTNGSAVTSVTNLASTYLVDGPNLKTGDRGGTGALINVDATGRLVDPTFKDTDPSPVADRKWQVKDGVIHGADSSGVETAEVVRLADPLLKDGDASPVSAVKMVVRKGIVAPVLATGGAPAPWALGPGTILRGNGVPTNKQLYAWVIDRATKNFILNPVFENNVTDGYSLIGTATRTRDTASNRHVQGNASMKLVMPNSAGPHGIAHAAINVVGLTGAFTFSLFMSTDAGATKTVRLIHRQKNSGGGVVLTTTTTHKIGTQPLRYFTSPNIQPTVETIELEVDNNGTAQGGFNVYLSALQAEQCDGPPTSFCSGDMGNGGYSWDAPAQPHNSTSSRLGGFQLLADPQQGWLGMTHLGQLMSSREIGVGALHEQQQIEIDSLGIRSYPDEQDGTKNMEMQATAGNARILASGDVEISPGATGKIKLGSTSFIAYKNASAQNLVGGAVYAKVTFDAEDHDDGNEFDLANDWFTTPAGVTAVYLFSVGLNVAVADQIALDVSLQIDTGGGFNERFRLAGVAGSGAMNLQVSGACIDRLGGGVKVAVFARVSGAAVNRAINLGSTICWFSARRIG